ncbi:MAG: hypothetical protein M1837_002258 [Sclerophora amabilis]|nr:MAG: hypothetical protein M1837_002258 [Sclerophora amabilis]
MAAQVPSHGQSQKRTDTHSSRLEDQAAIAALYVAQQEKSTHPGDVQSTEKGHKLSAASAAASLHYASPTDLPSYPILGLSDKDSSAGAAASLANANHKSFEHWKPDPSAAASAAAMLAKDVRPANVWRPELTAFGSRAALHAHNEGVSVSTWKPTSSDYGNSAAASAFRSGPALGPKIDHGYTEDGKKGSLMAATGAMSGSRKRAGSTPVRTSTFPDSANSAANALNAANIAHKPSVKKAATFGQTSDPMSSVDAARIHNIAKNKVSREMYTSHPPVALEVEERNKADTMHAAALVMAKQMYSSQQKAIDDASRIRRHDSHHAASSVHGRRLSASSTDDPGATPMSFVNLQEAARKLAGERLAKLNDEHASYRNYYGASPPAVRSSMRLKTRRRASSDGHKIDDDEEQSRRIRSQMSLFNDKVAEVDLKKRQKDRDALMAAAQRNVQRSMTGMDEKVFAKTGKVTPAMMEGWEAKAKATAEAESKSRMVNHGKVDIGGGKFLDQADVDLVATRNVQPVLDDINERAEKERARQEEIRLDQEYARQQAVNDKAREKEVKAELKNAKEIEKHQAKIRKEEEKAMRAEERRSAKEEKRKSRPVRTTSSKTDEPANEEASPNGRNESVESFHTPTSARSKNVAIPQPETSVAEPTAIMDPVVIAASPPQLTAVQLGRSTNSPETSPVSPTSPTSPTSPKSDSKVKSWLKGKLSRARKSSKSEDRDSTEAADKGKRKSGFIGGAALTGGAAANVSNSSLEDGRGSMREVAIAGRHDSPPSSQERQSRGRKRPGDPSPSSSISPPSPAPRVLGGVVASDDTEEAKDTFDQELVPPPSFGSATNPKSGSPVRDSRFSELL